MTMNPALRICLRSLCALVAGVVLFVLPAWGDDGVVRPGGGQGFVVMPGGCSRGGGGGGNGGGGGSTEPRLRTRRENVSQTGLGLLLGTDMPNSVAAVTGDFPSFQVVAAVDGLIAFDGHDLMALKNAGVAELRLFILSSSGRYLNARILFDENGDGVIVEVE